MYDRRLEQRILSLSQAILGEQDEALCCELLLSLTEALVPAHLSTDNRKDDVRIRRARDRIQGSLDQVLKLDEMCRELDLSKFQ